MFLRLYYYFHSHYRKRKVVSHIIKTYGYGKHFVINFNFKIRKRCLVICTVFKLSSNSKRVKFMICLFELIIIIIINGSQGIYESKHITEFHRLNQFFTVFFFTSICPHIKKKKIYHKRSWV